MPFVYLEQRAQREKELKKKKHRTEATGLTEKRSLFGNEIRVGTDGVIFFYLVAN